LRFSSIRHKRLSRLLAALAPLIAAVVVNASQKPTSAELAAITERGRLLAEYGATAWHATDAMLAQMQRSAVETGSNQVFKRRRAFERGELNEPSVALIPVTVASSGDESRQTEGSCDAVRRRDPHRTSWSNEDRCRERR
jgi:hypothetical protein